MSLKDRGDPPKTGSTAQVTVTVTRNKNDPSFTIGSYKKTILENTTISTVVETVLASDGDNTVRFLFWKFIHYFSYL